MVTVNRQMHAPVNIGVLIIEANDVVSINKYMMQWDDLVDVSVTWMMLAH